MNRRTIVQLGSVAILSYAGGRFGPAVLGANSAGAVGTPDAATPAGTICARPETTSTPGPTATIVPAVAAGSALPYLDIWSITVLSIAPAVVTPNINPTGRLLQVRYAIQNVTAETHRPPLAEFSLTDDAGNRANIDLSLNQQVLGSGIGLSIAGNSTENRSLIFDFPNSSSAQFVLESTKDPAFRVAVEIVDRG
jgi:hypothetical protein